MASASAAMSAGLFVGGVAVGLTGASLFGRQRSAAAGAITAPRPAPNAAEEVAASATLPSVDVSTSTMLIGGHPGPIADFLHHVAYLSSYDRARKHPHWTAEHITAAALRPPDDGKPRGDRKNSVFREDGRIPQLFRSRNADYFRSGYDRGHMVPAADCKSSQQSMDETFFLSNIAPQVGEGFNRDYWAHMEDFVRRMTAHFADLYVFTVPLYLPRQSTDGKWRVSYEVIGDPPTISVPTHFAKVIYGKGKAGTAPAPQPLPPPAGSLSSSEAASGGGLLSTVGLRSTQNYAALGAFVLPNAVIPNEAPLRSFAVPVEAVERAAGLQLFPEALKSGARPLCDTVNCSIVVRDFSDRNKQQQQQQASGGASPTANRALPVGASQPSAAASPTPLPSRTPVTGQA